MKKMLPLIIFCLSIITSTVYAKDIKMYEKPNAKSHVVSLLKPGQQLIPVYYPNKGDWIKVANPKNGDVGWVKINAFNGETILPDGQRATQTLSTQPGKGYQITIKSQSSKDDANAPAAIDQADIDAAMKEFQQKATQIQESMQIIMKNMAQQIGEMQKALPDDGDIDVNDQPKMNNVIIVPSDKSKQ